MSSAVRYGALAAGILLVFLITVVVLVRIIPAPRSETDYLVIGGVATLVSMAALFVVLITTIFRSPDTFFRTRKRP